MNLEKTFFKNSRWLRASAQVLRLRKSFSINRILHKKSLPPTSKDNEVKELEEKKSGGEIQPAKVQRDIFGATILPQNLSFENAKKLSDNIIRLKDIPLVDENEAAETLAAEKLKAKREKLSKPDKREKQISALAVVEEKTAKDSENVKSVAESFWIADAYEEIPGPKIFRSFVSGLKQIICQLTIVSLFRFLKGNTVAPFKTYGPIVRMPEIFGGKIVLISRPEHISAVFEQDWRLSTVSILDSIERSRFYRRRKGERTVYYLNREWNAVKKKIKKPLTQNAEKYFDGIDDASEKFLRRIRTIRNGQNEVPESFLFEINKWSLECLCFMIFDKSFGFLDYKCASLPSKTSQLLYSLTLATKKLCYLESGFQFWRIMNTTSLTSLGSACEVLENIISEYVGQVQLNIINKKHELDKEYRGGASVIENLLLQDGVTPDNVVCRVLDTLIIGMNTMSTALGFLLYHLSMNPRIQSKVWKEVKEILPEKYSRLEYEHLSSFKYIQACLKESLRLKMPMPLLSRILSRNVTIGNYQIPKGTFILMTAQVDCMKENNFENATEFSPERWLEHEIAHPFVKLPLGNYFDDSLQRRLAEISVWMCASLLSRHFTIDYTYGNIEATSTAISFPNRPLKFTFTDRKL